MERSVFVRNGALLVFLTLSSLLLSLMFVSPSVASPQKGSGTFSEPLEEGSSSLPSLSSEPSPGAVLDEVGVIDAKPEHVVTQGGVSASGQTSSTRRLSVPTGWANSVVLLNVTATDTQSNGYVSVWECGTTQPQTSIMNYVGQTWALPSFTFARTDKDGYVCLFTESYAELVVDLVNRAGLVLESNTQRVFDTRTSAAVPAGEVFRFNFGKPNTPILGTLTVTGTEGSGYTSVYPCLEGNPETSLHNYNAKQTIASYVISKADSAGNVCFYTSNRAHFVFDRQTLNQAGVLNNVVVPVKPARMLDTRSGKHNLLNGGTTRVRTGVKNGTVAGVLTTTGASGSGYTSLWNCEGSPPNVSINNYESFRNSTNFASVSTNALGEFCVFTSVATHLIWDQYGIMNALSNPPTKRLLDTRSWGSRTGWVDNEKMWTPLRYHKGLPIRWNPCGVDILVYLNPDNIGRVQENNVKIAVEKVRSVTGLPLKYAGLRSVMPTTKNRAGFVVADQIQIAFARPGQSDLLPWWAAGYGGFSYWHLPHTDGVVYHGYAILDSDWVGRNDSNRVISTIMHELGHSVGLGHVDAPSQIMHAPYLWNTTTQWGRGDMAGLHALGRASDCVRIR